MNALVGIRNNAGGFYSANRAQRQASRQSVESLTRATLQGRARAAKAAETGASQAAPKAAGTSGAGESETSRVLDRELDRDAFLQLLVQQMQSQDPLDPVDNSQMIAQLAQFSSLEQMTNLNDSFTQLSGNVDQLNFITANGLLGREVTGVDVDGNLVQGNVERVHMDGSLVYLTVGGKLVSMAGVMAIGTPAATGGTS